MSACRYVIDNLSTVYIRLLFGYFMESNIFTHHKKMAVMHIGFDAKRLFFNGSGLGNYSRSTVELLAKYSPDNEYTLFTPKDGNKCGFHVADDMNVVMPHGAMAKFGSLWRSYAMGRAVRRSGVEVFHGLSNELPSDIKRQGVKSVVTMHDVIFIKRPELYKPIDRWLYAKKYGRSCRDADRIIAISRQTAEDLMEVWGIPQEKINVVYQGCNPLFSQSVGDDYKNVVAKRYGLPSDYILSVGTIEARKNLILTVRAMVEGGVEGELVAVGRRTPYADEVMEYAVRNGVGGRVHMIHDVSFADLPAVYQMARAFVYPSFYEGFGIPILEAFNSRVPVISTRGGVFSETGGDACLYVDPHSVEEMTEALKRVCGGETLRSDMIERGLRHSAAFAEPVIAKNLMAVYESL